MMSLNLNFNKINGNFIFFDNRLISLKGAPKYVDGNFDCSLNHLISLVGSPLYLRGNCKICHNNIATLIDATPRVDGSLLMSYCDHLTSTYSCQEDLSPGEITYHKSWCDTLTSVLIFNLQHLILILKYQRHFFIWNDDLSLNTTNLKMLIDEIKDGLQRSEAIVL